MPSVLLRFLQAMVMALMAAPVAAQHAALTAPRNLDQLTDRADLIVHGTVIATRVEKHPELGSLDTVVVSLRVRETLKGQAAGVHTFRQYVWDIRDVQAMGGYRKGQELLLFLVAPSRHGLSSPAGQEQGRFQIRRDDAGRPFATNGRANRGLFDRVAAQAAKDGVALSARSMNLVGRSSDGPVALGDLLQLIRELAAGSP